MYEIIFKSSSLSLLSTICKMRRYWLWTFELNAFVYAKELNYFYEFFFFLFVNYLVFRSSITENVDKDRKKELEKCQVLFEIKKLQ